MKTIINHFLLLVGALLLLTLDLTSSFTNTKLALKGAAIVQQPLEFTIDFELSEDLLSTETIYIYLPRFTRKLDSTKTDSTNMAISMGSVVISPSLTFTAAWTEGTFQYSNTTPYRTGRLALTSRQNVDIASGSSFSITVYRSNGIGAFCGFPSSSQYNSYDYSTDSFRLTKDFDTYYSISTYSGLGNGCSKYKDCNGHGSCDYCYEKCVCDDGYGSSNDIISTGSGVDGTCSRRVCPAGKAIADIPSLEGTAHQTYAECSNVGVCDRVSGTCKCFPPYTGPACEKIGCPNDCSGHGKCMSMAEIAAYYGGVDTEYNYIYGTASGMRGSAWDYDVAYGCVCESTWDVGFGEGQYQVAQYFGPDCSLKRCPSGDNPYTFDNEQYCRFSSQSGAPGEHIGKKHNLCHVDCSNRGICDYSTGKCKCFEGSYGDNCALVANAGTKQFKFYDEFIAEAGGSRVANSDNAYE